MSLLLSPWMWRGTDLTLARLEDGEVVDHGARVRGEGTEKWSDLATLVLEKVLERAAEHPPPGRSSEMIEAAAAERFREIGDSDVRELLVYLAYTGYLCREVEEGWQWTEIGSGWVHHVLTTGSEVAGTSRFEELVSWVAVHACDRTRADQPPGFCIDAIDDPLWVVRDFVMARFCQIQVEVCEREKLSQPNSLPPGTEMADFMAGWRIGVLVRTCEQSVRMPS